MTDSIDSRIRDSRYPHEAPVESGYDSKEAYDAARMIFYRGQAELTERFFEAVPFAAISTLHDGTIVYANAPAQLLFRLTKADLTRHRAVDYLYDADGHAIGSKIGARVASGEIIRQEAVYVRVADHEPVLRMLSVTPVLIPGTQTLARAIGLLMDPSPCELENQSLASLNRGLNESLRTKGEEADRFRVMAYTDDMTGVPNKRAFWESLRDVLDEVRRKGEPFALFAFDPDGFKGLNDTYGHRAGDNLVRVVAARLRHVTEMYEGFVARVGGDEFCAYFRGMDANDYAQVGKRFAEAMNFQFEVKDKVTRERSYITVSVSIGGTHRMPGDVIPEPGDLCEEADEAMYESKASGSGLAKTRPVVLRSAPTIVSTYPPKT